MTMKLDDVSDIAPVRPLTADDLDSCLAPDITDLPMSNGEDGDWYGWGHIDPTQFAAAANALEQYLGSAGDEPWKPEDVEHRWAVTLVAPEEAGEEWRFDWAKPGHDANAWPVTVLRP